MSEWWNGQTRTFEGRMPQGVGVQVPPPTPLRRSIGVFANRNSGTLFLLENRWKQNHGYWYGFFQRGNIYSK